MSRIRAKIGVVLGSAAVALAAGFVAAPGASASAADCHDGVFLWNYYMSIGDYATANPLLSNLIGMGCADIN